MNTIKYITTLEGLKGKTIRRAQISAYDQTLCLTFHDDTVCILSTTSDMSIVFDVDIVDVDKFRFGLITEQEYNDIHDERDRKEAESLKAARLMQYKILHEEFGKQ